MPLKKDDYQLEYRATLPRLRSYYDQMQNIPGLIASEVTFTFAPGRCDDIQKTKKRCMSLIAARLKQCKYLVGAIMTRENHENGWPHVHGIVWFPEDHNNALTLSGGRLWVPRKSKAEPAHWICNELGNTRIDPLRVEPYTKYTNGLLDPGKWASWFDYITKEQHVAWTDPNLIVIGSYSIDNFFSKPKVETTID